MARFIKKIGEALGRSPAELVFIGREKVRETTISVIDYDHNNLIEKDLKDLRDSIDYKNKDTVTWININGLNDIDVIRQAGNYFDLHTIVLDNIVNTGLRPKMVDYDDYLFFALKMMSYDEDEGVVKSEQLSIFLGEKFIITFQEQPGDVFDPVRERIRKNKGRIRKVGVDYLAYALLDVIVDNYIQIIERLGEKIEDIEDEILGNPSKDLLIRINNYKREMNYLRKAVRPAKDCLYNISRLDSDLIKEDSHPFFNDLQGLSSHAMEVIDSYREMLSDNLNIYNTWVGNRLNEIMKFLTIFSAVFIPLTFIAGIYGTNFEYLPELKFKYSYFIMWGVFVLVIIGMLLFFRKKKWL